MAVILTRNWWALALRGLAGIIFGIITFAWPGISLAALVLLFGAYALTDGIFAIAMTLLVLELRVPDLPKSTGTHELLQRIGEEMPAILPLCCWRCGYGRENGTATR